MTICAKSLAKGERKGFNHAAMKELEVAATIRNRGANASLRAESLKKIKKMPRRYTT